MADYTLSNGRAITFDLSQISLKIYRQLIKAQLPMAEEDEIISRALGLTVEEYQNLPTREWSTITQALMRRCREPLHDPNSQSASIST